KRIRQDMREAKAEARAEEAKHRKNRLARGLSPKTGTGIPEPALTIWSTGRPTLRFKTSGGFQKMMQAQKEAATKRDRALMPNLQPGASRLGGLPDLPPAVEWPTFKRKKIPFLAQLNLSQLPRSASPLLPRDGHLLAFALLSNEKDCYPS